MTAEFKQHSQQQACKCLYLQWSIKGTRHHFHHHRVDVDEDPIHHFVDKSVFPTRTATDKQVDLTLTKHVYVRLMLVAVLIIQLQRHSTEMYIWSQDHFPYCLLSVWTALHAWTLAMYSKRIKQCIQTLAYLRADVLFAVLGGRGVSHVSISTTTSSKYWNTPSPCC